MNDHHITKKNTLDTRQNTHQQSQQLGLPGGLLQAEQGSTTDAGHSASEWKQRDALQTGAAAQTEELPTTDRKQQQRRARKRPHGIRSVG